MRVDGLSVFLSGTGLTERMLSRIIGGIDVQQDLAALADLVAAEADKLIQQRVVQTHQIAGGRRVLE
jgi:hypothetical protein